MNYVIRRIRTVNSEEWLAMGASSCVMSFWSDIDAVWEEDPWDATTFSSIKQAEEVINAADLRNDLQDEISVQEAHG